ncbi:MAG: hypothetical protein OSA48_02890 [Akkermansiaceae bacterium]|nr:hypothetical protein [Akkermansiaceae bacterium]
MISTLSKPIRDTALLDFIPLRRRLSAALLLSAASAPALEVVLDFTMDENNYNWFNPAHRDSLPKLTTLSPLPPLPQAPTPRHTTR